MLSFPKCDLSHLNSSMIFNCSVVEDLMVQELYEGPHSLQAIFKKMKLTLPEK